MKIVVVNSEGEVTGIYEGEVSFRSTYAGTPGTEAFPDMEWAKAQVRRGEWGEFRAPLIVPAVLQAQMEAACKEAAALPAYEWPDVRETFDRWTIAPSKLNRTISRVTRWLQLLQRRI